MPESTNDNAFPPVARAREADAHGQAALLLVESLIHALIERSVISTAEAIEVVDIAVEVRADLAEDSGECAVSMKRSLDLLAAISSSLGPVREPSPVSQELT